MRIPTVILVQPDQGLADGGPRVEFEIVFPRPGAYRLWVQFQSDGIVNTVRFDVPVGSSG